MNTIVASRLWIFLAISISWATGAAGADDPPARSLIFTPAESDALSRAISDFDRISRTGVPIEEEKPQTPNIYVSAVADYGSGRWTVWANGYRITPNRQSPLFKVLAVQDEFAVIRVMDDKQERVLLRPDQTWLSRSHQIVEGIVP